MDKKHYAMIKDESGEFKEIEIIGGGVKKDNRINQKAREMFEKGIIFNVDELMETAYQMKLLDDLKKIQDENKKLM